MKKINKSNNYLNFQKERNPKYVALPMLLAQMKDMKYFQEIARNQINASTTNASEEACKLVTKYRKENPTAKTWYSNIQMLPALLTFFYQDGFRF